MITLIVGNKGSGKTKKLLDLINSAVNTSKGSIVCIEKEMKLTYEIDHSVRLCDADEYGISGYDAFYGFVTGLLAGNYDITEIFIDGILRIGGRNYDDLGAFLAKINEVAEKSETKLTVTVSADAADLPESVKKYM